MRCRVHLRELDQLDGRFAAVLASWSPDPANVAVSESEPDSDTVMVDRTPERTRLSSFSTEASEAPTFSLPIAALIMLGRGDAPSTDYRLGTLNYIGRSEDNLIQITEPCASRRHSVVVGTPEGFLLRDLQSQNGTFVNGEQVRERLLADGDRIQIGDVQLIFRSPWGGRAPR